MTCTFFGHRDCSDDVYDELKAVIIDLVIHKGVKKFIVGNNGNFDRLVIRVLRECKAELSCIDYCVALAYLQKNPDFNYPTVYFEGLESVPKRFAVYYRNKIMINKCDWVIGYINHNCGGAYSFFELARKQGKNCINLYKT